MFHVRSLLGRCFRCFILPISDYCSAVWCSADDIHFNYWTVQSVVNGSSLGVCLSVTLLIVDLLQFCVCCIISGVTRCTRLINDALPGPYVPVRVTRGALVEHRHTYAISCCSTWQCRTFVPLSVSLWDDLTDPVFDGV